MRSKICILLFHIFLSLTFHPSELEAQTNWVKRRVLVFWHTISISDINSTLFTHLFLWFCRCKHFNLRAIPSPPLMNNSSPPLHGHCKTKEPINHYPNFHRRFN
ncbi:hypothetical protein SLA2020_263230 [Shorea laevis]